MIKNQHSTYLPSKRLPEYWIKLKPEYLDNIATDLDLLIVGTAIRRISRRPLRCGRC